MRLLNFSERIAYENYEFIMNEGCGFMNFGVFSIIGSGFSGFVILFVNCSQFHSKNMVTIHTKYLGDLRTSAVHVQSGNTLITDAPVDNKGRGEAFSPTDLLATALGSCMITIAGMTAREYGFSVDGTVIDITKVMASDPRRVCEVIVVLNFPGNSFTEKQKDLIRVSCLNCPVAKSLHPDLKQTVVFNF